MISMITLYLHDDEHGREIRSALEDLCLAHRVVFVDNGAARPQDLPPGEPPLLIDDGELHQGLPAIREQIRRLAELAHQWRVFQSDTCYCDETGPR
jgi:hypothetical protein